MRNPRSWLLRGYDVHVTFLPHQQDAARVLMDAFLAYVDRCGIPYERPILFADPVGPWTTPMWQILLRRENDPGALAQDLGECVGWLMANRDGLSVMIHPNSIDGDLADHEQNATWMGEPTPLKLSIF